MNPNERRVEMVNASVFGKKMSDAFSTRVNRLVESIERGIDKAIEDCVEPELITESRGMIRIRLDLSETCDDVIKAAFKKVNSFGYDCHLVDGKYPNSVIGLSFDVIGGKAKKKS